MNVSYVYTGKIPERLDKYLSGVTDLSRQRVKELADEGLIFVDDKAVKASYRLSEGEKISFEVPENTEPEIVPEDMPLDILYEDGDIIVINKPKGMVVHPAPGHYRGTVVNALLFHCRDLSGINGVNRPGIVHRLDKDTSGCLAACKNDQAHNAIASQLSDKTAYREYLAVVEGVIEPDNGIIDAPIGRDPNNRQRMTVTDKNGKEALTRFRVLERFARHTLIECRLETGRTHQIRVHMKYIGHPVTGDEVYGRKCSLTDTAGQVLHARKLTLIHPRSKETMTFEAPLPAYFRQLLDLLKGAQ